MTQKRKDLDALLTERTNALEAALRRVRELEALATIGSEYHRLHNAVSQDRAQVVAEKERLRAALERIAGHDQDKCPYEYEGTPDHHLGFCDYWMQSIAREALR